MSLTLRLQKGSELTWEELDGNFTFITSSLNNLSSSFNTNLNNRISSITLFTSEQLHSSPVNFTNVSGSWSGSLNLLNQSSQSFLASPTGSNGIPSFRNIFDIDIPINLNGRNFLTSVNISGSLNINGLGGNGFISYISQSSAPSSPTSGFRLYANSSHALSWIGQNGFIRTFDGTSNTANRIYTLPNFDGSFLLTSTTPSSGSVLFGTGTTIGQDNTNFFWDNILKKLEVSKLYVGNADYYFENDFYTTERNTLKIGGVVHNYGIAKNGQNGGMDYTFFKENGDASGNRTPIIADRRVLPNQEIAYHQYSAHNGVDSIYDKKSIAVVARASPSSNSTLGNMKGTYTIVTANNNGFDVSPLTIDVFISEQKTAFNAPVNITTNDLTRTVNIFGNLVSTTGLYSNQLELTNGGIIFNQYVNGEWRLKKGSSSFDILKVNEGTRPVAIQGGATHLPFYIYTDSGGGGFTNSLSVSTGLYFNSNGGFFNINNNESFRYDFGAGGRIGVNTGSGINANLDVRGNAAISRIFQAKNSSSVELFSVNENGRVIINPTIGNTLIGSPTDNALGKLQITGNCYISGTLRIGTITISTGTGSPEGVVTATVGSQFMRTDGGANTTLYVKESGTGNTGWVAK